MPAAIGGKASGSAMRLSAMNPRSAASGASRVGTKAAGSLRGVRLISARGPSTRKITSGSRPMIE